MKSLIVIKDFTLDQSYKNSIRLLIKKDLKDFSLSISKKIIEIVKSDLTYELIKAAHLYFKRLFTLENNLELTLKSGVKTKANFDYNLNESARTMAYYYGRVSMLHLRKINFKEETQVLETLIYFIRKVLEPAYALEHVYLLEEELNRLFRSSAFSTTQKHTEATAKLLPNIKKLDKSDPQFLQKITFKTKIQKKKPKSKTPDIWNVRPGCDKNSAMFAMNQRSPLLSVLFPGDKDKLISFKK